MTPTDPHGHKPAQDAHLYDDGVEVTSGDELHNPDVAHEHSDINVRAVIIAAIVLAGVTAFAFLAMRGVFALLERQAAANDPQLSPMAVPAGQRPPAPRLLTNEPKELENMRAAESKMLGEYGYVDRATGTVHVPIAEAKKLILQRGLPVRAEGPADPALGTTAPASGESSSGRAIPVLRPPKATPPPAETQPTEAKPPEAKKEGKG